jgi:hypothetical protein
MATFITTTVRVLLGAALAASVGAGCSRTDDAEIRREPADSTGEAGVGEAFCPEGLPGPDLVRLTAPGGRYCMDAREVSFGEYAAFLEAAKSKPPATPKGCEWNESLTPNLIEKGTDMFPTHFCYRWQWQPEQTPDQAVHCVDFCDALTYCTWAGKRLCGKLGASTEKTAFENSEIEQTVTSPDSEWYFACSQAGKTKYPYRGSGPLHRRSVGGGRRRPHRDRHGVARVPRQRRALRPDQRPERQRGGVAKYLW